MIPPKAYAYVTVCVHSHTCRHTHAYVCMCVYDDVVKLQQPLGLSIISLSHGNYTFQNSTTH